eukprot:TRINITY_DN717_c0_g1_i2.p1 TRINITY_DN717_c0_g1~~TRINITY_DN717_c0_g1_i2.p1  ORF type:complete len:368 (+),score=102.54 TRINITY_DN717_c0_g1_i2:91-1194(+)
MGRTMDSHRLAFALCLSVCAVLLLGWQRQEEDGSAFVASPAIPRSFSLRSSHLQHGSERPPLAADAGIGSSATGLIAASAFLVAAAVGAARRSSSIARRVGITWSGHSWERKWWSIEETRDPTTLPLWQRDLAYGYRVLRSSMITAVRRGEKVFWDCRVLSSDGSSYKVEMLNSGLLGRLPKTLAGKGTNLQVGEVYKMECIQCPTKKHHKEWKYSPWPREAPQQVVFSHISYLENQRNIAKAKEMIAGDIVEGYVCKKLAKGLLINLEGQGQDGAKGMLDMHDISRKMSSHIYVNKMFPVGTKMKMYVVHSDHNNGRITLSTKEFEDDDHMGWMLSFPERMMFKNAEKGVAKYHQKRDAYIKWLQR